MPRRHHDAFELENGKLLREDGAQKLPPDSRGSFSSVMRPSRRSLVTSFRSTVDKMDKKGESQSKEQKSLVARQALSGGHPRHGVDAFCRRERA